jgi:ornithine cyclodeaminase/alanine dehydrogenase
MESVLTMKENIQALERAFIEYAEGNVKMPLRPTIAIDEFHGKVYFMPAYVGGDVKALGIKVVSGFDDNPTKHNLPFIQGTVLLYDARNGTLLSMMDGAYLTGTRTGATSGVATKYMARKDAKSLGIFGAGVQGETHLLAMCEVRTLSRAKVFDVSKQKAVAFSEKMRKVADVDISVANTEREVVEKSDIIVTATTSKQPLFKGEWLEPGCHINGVGSHSGPGVREVDTATVKRSLVVVDSKEACLREAGDLIDPIAEKAISQDHIYADLGEVVAGKKKGRLKDDDITFFKSVGLALEDVSTALRIYDLAQKHGVGKNIAV